MSVKVFLDTNILVYAHTDLDLVKQSTAQKLIIDNISFLSTQVLQETANTLKRKFAKSWNEIITVLNEAKTHSNLHVNTDTTILQACNLAELYRFSFYDCLIISSALECGCSILYSEDMQNDQLIDKKLRIINPFKAQASI